MAVDDGDCLFDNGTLLISNLSNQAYVRGACSVAVEVLDHCLIQLKRRFHERYGRALASCEVE